MMEEVFGSIFAACEVARLTEKERQEYTEDAMTTEMDRKNILYTRELRGMEKGEKKKALEIARNMREMGFPDETILAATKLTPEQLKSL